MFISLKINNIYFRARVIINLKVVHANDNDHDDADTTSHMSTWQARIKTNELGAIDDIVWCCC